MMSRLFVALHIPDEVLNRIIELRNIIYPDDGIVKWEKKDKLHITLKFIGDVQKADIPEIVESIEEVLKRSKSFDLQFEKFGVFKRNNSPKILWAGLTDNQHLTNCVNSINRNLEKLGIEKEKRKFKPHLTILRVRGRENFENIAKFQVYNFENINFTGSKISLFESTLLKSGSVYNLIKSFDIN